MASTSFFYAKVGATEVTVQSHRSLKATWVIKEALELTQALSFSPHECYINSSIIRNLYGS